MAPDGESVREMKSPSGECGKPPREKREEMVTSGRGSRRSFERQVNRSISDVSVEVSRGGGHDSVEMVQCGCCGLLEECTPTYISKVKQHFGGHWICGLCEEAVREECSRMGGGANLHEALSVHMGVCVRFNKVARPNPALSLADAMKQMLKKRKESSHRRHGIRSNPNSPRPPSSIARTTSCIPAFVKD